MKPQYLTLLGFLFCMTGATKGADTAVTITGDDVRAQIESHDAATQEWTGKMRAASREERAELLQAKPDPTKTAQTLDAFLKNSFKDEAAIPAMVWLNRYGTRIDGIDFKIDQAMLDKVAETHLANEKLGDFCMMLYRNPLGADFLKTVSEKSPNKQAQGLSLYAQALAIQRDDAQKDAYLAIVDRIIEEFPDLESRGRNIGNYFKGKRFAAENLVVGKIAPEIEGKTVDGEPLKLSAYRGKVVVIDFWGDW